MCVLRNPGRDYVKHSVACQLLFITYCFITSRDELVEFMETSPGLASRTLCP